MCVNIAPTPGVATCTDKSPWSAPRWDSQALNRIRQRQLPLTYDRPSGPARRRTRPCESDRRAGKAPTRGNGCQPTSSQTTAVPSKAPLANLPAVRKAMRPLAVFTQRREPSSTGSISTAWVRSRSSQTLRPGVPEEVYGVEGLLTKTGLGLVLCHLGKDRLDIGGHQVLVHRDGVAIQCARPQVVTDQLGQVLLVGLALAAASTSCPCGSGKRQRAPAILWPPAGTTTPIPATTTPTPLSHAGRMHACHMPSRPPPPSRHA